MRLIIAGGGTGGHLFPALAIARAIRAMDPEANIIFVGTRHGIESRIIPESGFPLRFIRARGIRKTGLINTLSAGLEIPMGVAQSFSIIRKFRPGFVLGVGGYASGPTLAAAVIMRIPTAIQEQNSVMGTTNRLLSGFVDRIFTSWEVTEPAPPQNKTLVAGNPVREDLFQSLPGELDLDRFKILVFGGSRGARSINLALADNLDVLQPLAGRIRILHQTGQMAVEDIKRAYDEAGIQADVREFIHEMGPAYHWADLVVCRSGASSLAEITALGKPAIVVPYPYAIGDHQTRNARVLESAGALRIVPDENLKNGALVKQIRMLIENPDELADMAGKSRNFGRPDAARTIAHEILNFERNRP
jgi:UDP-N-acetylglucosamine--N-acetylmuramyl-(pentapeptide) pyrophosphoryl-undecaprenol N-acetylglucosamine transferase